MRRVGLRPGIARLGALALLLACVVSVEGLAQIVERDAGAVNRDVATVNQAIQQAGVHWTAGITSVARLNDAERALRCGTKIGRASCRERV